MKIAMRLLLPGVIVLFGMGIATTVDATDDDQTTLFLNLTTDVAWETQMALSYAEKVRDMGHPVVVFLNSRAVRWANAVVPQPTLAAPEKTPRDILAHLLAKGVEVHVCPMCTEYAGLSHEDWMDGVVAGGPKTIEIQMDPLTKVMSY